MKYSVSTYSLWRLVTNGEATEEELISIAAKLGFDGIEFAEIHPPKGADKAKYAFELKEECDRVGVTPVNYSIGADLLSGDETVFHGEIARLKNEVDIAVLLGVSGMRHDAASGFSGAERKFKGFDQALPRIIEGYRSVTEYAAKKEIRTMIENHGFFCQDSARVERIITGVGHRNFGLLMDIGNFLCADEAPEKACGLLSPFISHVHIKDFHIKSGNAPAPCNGFFKTRGGNYLRGAIVGHGNVPVLQCLSIIKNSGYDGFLTIEFEGCEEPKTACAWGLENLKRDMEILDHE